MRLLKFFAAGLLLLAAPLSRAADVPIFPTGPVFTVSPSLVWGVSTAGGFNQNFFFTPIATNVCVFVYNNNPTSPHTFSATIQVTGNPNEKTPSDGTWQSAAFIRGLNVPASPSNASGLGVNISGNALVSINFTESTTQAGSPDTATLIISQSAQQCPSGNGLNATGIQSVAAGTLLQNISDSLSQGYSSFGNAANPAANTLLTNVNVNGAAKNVYFDHATISSTAAGEVDVNFTNSLGTTCNASTGTNLKNTGFGSPSNSSATVNNSCTGLPTIVSRAGIVFVGANQTITVDLRGFICGGGSLSTCGMDINVPTAIAAGTVSVNLFWYEK